MTEARQNKWQPDAAQREILEELRDAVAESRSLSAFARDYLAFGDSTLSKVLNALDPASPSSYFDNVEDHDRVWTMIEAGLDNYRMARRRQELAGGDHIYPLKKFQAVHKALKICQQEKGRNRIVTYIAPTGGGKTYLCNYLFAQHKIRSVQAREAWRRGDNAYSIFLRDVGRVLGVRFKSARRETEMEDILLEFCGSRQVTLAIDEGEYFGSAVLNGIRLLMNSTQLVLLFCVIRERYEQWSRWYSVEADQLKTRTRAFIELSEVTPEDADHFFPQNQFKDRDTALERIAASASTFGYLSFVARVRSELATIKAAAATDLDVKKAIDAASRQMRLEAGVEAAP